MRLQYKKAVEARVGESTFYYLTMWLISPFYQSDIKETIKNSINIISNNVTQSYLQDNCEDIANEQLRKTFAINAFSYLYMTKVALSHLY